MCVLILLYMRPLAPRYQSYEGSAHEDAALLMHTAYVSIRQMRSSRGSVHEVAALGLLAERVRVLMYADVCCRMLTYSGAC